MRACLEKLRTLFISLCLLTLLLSGCNWGSKTPLLQTGPNAPRDTVAIFFSKTQGSKSIVEEVVRQLPADAKAQPLAFALKELLEGPTDAEKQMGFYSEIPAGTKLLGLQEKGDTVTINLSGQFASGGGSTSMNQRFEELKHTVFSVEDADKIDIAVEGKQLELLGGEGLEVKASLKREPR